MAEFMTEEEIKQIDQVVEQPKPRKRRKAEDIELADLENMKGSDIIKILDFLHRRYLSWMTEAESAKFSSLYKSAKDEALKETLEVYSEIQKQNQELLERMERLIQALEGRLTATPEQIAQVTAQQTVEQAKKSILEDPRVRALGFIIFDYLSSKDPNLAKYKDIVKMILFPELLQSEAQQTAGTQTETQGATSGTERTQ
jgi:hypothetical protein